MPEIPTKATDEMREYMKKQYLISDEEVDDLYEQVIYPELKENAR